MSGVSFGGGNTSTGHAWGWLWRRLPEGWGWQAWGPKGSESGVESTQAAARTARDEALERLL